MIVFLNSIRKTLAALVIGVIGWGTVVVTSDPTSITSSEWLQLAVAGATALGVYSIANVPGPAPAVPKDDAGQVNAGTVIAILTLVGVALLVFGWAPR